MPEQCNSFLIEVRAVLNSIDTCPQSSFDPLKALGVCRDDDPCFMGFCADDPHKAFAHLRASGFISLLRIDHTASRSDFNSISPVIKQHMHIGEGTLLIGTFQCDQRCAMSAGRRQEGP